MQPKYYLPLLLVWMLCSSKSPFEDVWGFWGHRRINRLAVFTLPPEMAGFYKKNLEYITEHAVDPDKRRYASKFEGSRHYIDIDHWGTYPFPDVPRDWNNALRKYAALHVINPEGDTLQLLGHEVTKEDEEGQLQYIGDNAQVQKILANGLSGEEYQEFFEEHLSAQYFEDTWQLDCQNLKELLGSDFPCSSAFAIDHLTEYGIVPYYLPTIQNRLSNALRGRNVAAILRLSAEIGHYIADAHVPLHTTENYNGQLTDQLGIHAFWESRLPELFADETYDYFVGPADYIAEPKAYYWEIVLESHRLLDSVLLIEKDLSKTFPKDRQYCYEERLGRTIRTQCRDYAEAYHNRMGGMVERRMQDAIHAVGSVWYTAWIDAGQPNLMELEKELEEVIAQEERLMKELNEAYQKGENKGRSHQNN